MVKKMRKVRKGWLKGRKGGESGKGVVGGWVRWEMGDCMAGKVANV